MTRRAFHGSLWLSLCAADISPAMEKPNLEKLHGRVQWVNSFPDYKIKIVESSADLHVKLVTSFPDDPGEWQTVKSFPDFKIQIVDSFPDFTVKYVESFPGVQG